jgi:hypothetical protein
MQTETHAAAITRAQKLIDAEERHRAFSTLYPGIGLSRVFPSG